MSEKVVRTAVIGCGGIAQHAHLPAIRRNGQEQLVAVADAFEDLAHKVGRNYGLADEDIYGDYAEVLQRDDVDAVTVCTWTGLHAEISAAALEAGKHVIVEKPMAITSEDAQRMVDAAEKSDRLLMIAYNHTYDLATDYVKGMLETDELGELLYAEVFFYEDAGAWDAGAYRRTLRSDEAPEGGSWSPARREKLLHYIHNFDSHVLNLMRVLLGEPEGIEFCRWTEGSGLWAMLDYGGYRTYFKNVETGQRRFEKGIEICGSEKRVRLELAPPLERYAAGTVRITDAGSQTESSPFLEYRWPFELEHEHFSSCVLEGRQPLTSGRQALNDVILAERLTDIALDE